MKEEMNNWYLYLIRTRQGALYTGITTDVKRRFAEHSAQGPKCAKSLRGKAPLELVLKHFVGARTDALKLEHKIKQLDKQQKEYLIKHKSLLQLGLI